MAIDAVEILLQRIDLLDAKLDLLYSQDRQDEDEWQQTRLEIMATQDMLRELRDDQDAALVRHLT